MIFNFNKKKKLLFVVPTASINGAIIVLMNFFVWLKNNNKEYSIEIIVQWGKDDNADAFFRNKLSSFGQVIFLEELDENGKHKLKQRLLKEKIDCVFYNSIISVLTQQYLADLNAPKIYFVHELERLMHTFGLANHLELYQQKNTHFIACAQSVKDHLKKVLQIPDNRITVIHEFIDLEHMTKEIAKSALEKNLIYNKKENDRLPEITIGLSGTFELRKSADLLPSLVIEIKKRIKNAKVFWVGASPFNGEPGTFDMVMNDVLQAGLTNDIVFIPKGLGHYKYYNRFDVFIMLSREDPFPVVNIEMGALGVPIVCFKGSGGAEEYAKMGGGVAVPFMDLGAIADQIAFFYNNPDELKRYKKTAPKLVMDNFILEVQSPKIYQVIENLATSPKRSHIYETKVD